MRKEQLDKMLTTPQGRGLFVLMYGATMLGVLEGFRTVSNMGQAWLRHVEQREQLAAPANVVTITGGHTCPPIADPLDDVEQLVGEGVRDGETRPVVS